MSKIRSYVLFRADDSGPGLAEVAERVRATPEVELIKEGSSGLLVQGGSAAVESLAHELEGWQAEANTAMSTGR